MATKPSDYVKAYRGDVSAIAFIPDNGSAEEFRDDNAEFRDAVIRHVVANPTDAPLPLLVDLYSAPTELSAEAWSIDNRVEDIARLMLTMGGVKVAEDYIAGAMQSFDAHCATSFSGCPKPTAEACLTLARTKLSSATDKDQEHFWMYGIERFEQLVEHATE